MHDNSIRGKEMSEQERLAIGLLIFSSSIIGYAFYHFIFYNDVVNGTIYLISGFIFLICSGIFDEFTKNGSGKIFQRGLTKRNRRCAKND